jgi:iron complex transport system substrate-binding protein
MFRLSILRFSAAALILVILAACGAPAAETSDSDSAARDASPSPAASPAAEESPEAEASPKATASERVIQHAMGETTVPANPQRVVVLDTGELDAAMTLGIKPVGAVEAIPGQGFPSYLEGTEGIENVGTIAEPNLEQIATLNPDLILSSKLRHEEIYNQLSEIAPTVFAETTGVTWKENFDLFAEALGRIEAANIVKEEYQGRIEEFQQAMGDQLKETEVSVVRFTPGDTRIYQKASFSGTVLEDAGLPRPPSQDVDEFAITNASEEIIPEIGGDVIFVTVYGSEDETAKQAFLSHPLWQQLNAVQQGRVYEVSDDLWMLGIGYTAANGVIDDLTRYLVEEGATPGTPTANTATTEATAGESAFPVTIEHKYGSTEISVVPERVVTVGLTDHDAVLALGVTPIAVRDWFGDQPSATWPWAQDELGDATPAVLPSGELNFEQIVALKPDVILGVYSGLDEQEYKTLSEIAPTVAQPSEYVDFGVPWQEQTRIIGRALGREEQAEQLVANVEAQFQAVRDEHPEFEGATGVVALTWEGSYLPYGPKDPRARFLTALGFELPSEIAELAGDEFYATISRERLDLIDADVLVWLVNSPAERKTIEDDPIYQQLGVAKEGRDLFLELNEPLGGAISFSSVLSLPYLLDEFVPMLAAAIDGGPSTETVSG